MGLPSTTHGHDDDLPDQEQVTVSTLSLLPLPVLPMNIESSELEKHIPAMAYTVCFSRKQARIMIKRRSAFA
ncbi:hypothetical protein FEM48_Zijuj03G0187800 [Ziziphus jujuba var. spinosa]|uniref:Uncharacterized protein n=1 Tax=Ziziphus jujuba var. spinosa TaxID=714518 RepID=A0A978VS02_ZIZJJ|nr:hypothetical protein FEM48_Zijuj03G0187800 [Ziziphus jujuba var. spinosa]